MDLDIAFSDTKRTLEVSRAKAVAERTVRITNGAVAGNLRAMVLAALRKWRRAAEESPALAIVHLREYDSCKYTLRNSVHLPLLDVVGSQTARAINIMQQVAIYFESRSNASTLACAVGCRRMAYRVASGLVSHSAVPCMMSQSVTSYLVPHNRFFFML